MKNINGGTGTVCLIGNPIAHSFSPFIHNYGFDLHNINTVYLAHLVEDDSTLEQAVYGMKALNYLGCNVTYPFKTSVIPFLDELSEDAKLIGAVNTIHNRNGKLIGYNTDGLGFVEGLKNKGFNLNYKNVCILGAGGAARSIIVALLRSFNCNITICNRDVDKALEISDSLSWNNSFLGKIHRCITPSQLAMEKDLDVLINCTPIGMKPNDDCIPFSEQLSLNESMLVCDLIYHPYETKLLKDAKAIGCEIHYGLDMLIFQAILAFKIWTDKELPYNNVENLLMKKIY